jgi:hypothetical protein
MTNPILSEINGLSPDAKTALINAHAATSQPSPSPAPSSPLTTQASPQSSALIPSKPLPTPPGMQSPSSVANPPAMSAQGGSPSPEPIMQPATSLSAPPARGTLAGDQAERARLESTGDGISQIHSKIENSALGKAHPTLGKILGWGAEIPARIGEVAGSLVGPTRIAEEFTPGTQLHHERELSNLNSTIGHESEEGAQAATTAHTQSETTGQDLSNLNEPQKAADTHALSGATTANLQSETEHRGDQKDQWKEITGFTGPKGEPLEINEATGETRPAATPGAKVTAKAGNPQQETYDSLIKQGLTPIQAYEKIREKPGGTTINQGTWALDEDPTTGKPVLFNSKTGETKDAPAGVAKAGTFAKSEAATAPAKQALEYANGYVSRAAHTGPGDEALMEKFFELAKPSTGFRMSQPQIDMLKNAQSWQSSLEAHLRHATTGTWFSDEQRKEIASTMADLAKAKGLTPGGATGGAAPAEGTIKTNSAGDKIKFSGGKWGPA